MILGEYPAWLRRTGRFDARAKPQNEAARLDKRDIEKRQLSRQSMMPDGLLAMLSPAEVRDLIMYVSGPGQVPLPPGPHK